MSDLTERISELSPEKRALLTKLLKKKREQQGKENAIVRRDNLKFI